MNLVMNALLLTDYMHLEMTRVPEPEVGPEDVLVRVRACGICGSDVHGLDGSTGRRIPPSLPRLTSLGLSGGTSSASPGGSSNGSSRTTV